MQDRHVYQFQRQEIETEKNGATTDRRTKPLIWCGLVKRCG